ncbi:MAG: flagellar biosynthetic protein FliQ [Roseibaca calidilacus]|uniref:Flagellar biosynthetic protein FliQ n=1 Tax=Roseibaca calidilacus TaxID=1666912 RepID=A0A0P7W699_9RHOB|nr:flagellar biosynthesis protein FliQ [Roseibaca calidilacus]KPP95549.1 MAG: flagellar biosynthetic protein FliQ [Roseibaca calidilacus]CUX82109.1 flagellar biosynthetic protein FliQ [Roseibaca calidilacus]
MDYTEASEQLQLAYFTILKVAGPVLAVALGVGLLIGVLQAATSINEQTLSFVPKLAVVFIAMALGSALMLGTLSDYFLFVFEQVQDIR